MVKIDISSRPFVSIPGFSSFSPALSGARHGCQGELQCVCVEYTLLTWLTGVEADHVSH